MLAAAYDISVARPERRSKEALLTSPGLPGRAEPALVQRWPMYLDSGMIKLG